MPGSKRIHVGKRGPSDSQKSRPVMDGTEGIYPAPVSFSFSRLRKHLSVVALVKYSSDSRELNDKFVKITIIPNVGFNKQGFSTPTNWSI